MPFKIKDVVLIDSSGDIFANVIKPTALRSVYRGIGGIAAAGYIGGGGTYGHFVPSVSVTTIRHRSRGRIFCKVC